MLWQLKETTLSVGATSNVRVGRVCRRVRRWPAPPVQKLLGVAIEARKKLLRSSCFTGGERTTVVFCGGAGIYGAASIVEGEEEKEYGAVASRTHRAAHRKFASVLFGNFLAHPQS